MGQCVSFLKFDISITDLMRSTLPKKEGIKTLYKYSHDWELEPYKEGGKKR
jgi:hypothetical protein